MMQSVIDGCKAFSIASKSKFIALQPSVSIWADERFRRGFFPEEPVRQNTSTESSLHAIDDPRPTTQPRASYEPSLP